MLEPRVPWARIIGIGITIALVCVVGAFLLWAAFMLTAPRM